MDTTVIFSVGALAAAASLGLLAYGKSRRHAETLTIEALLAAAQAAHAAQSKALDDADRLAAQIGRELTAGQQALSADLAAIAAARAKLQTNVAAPAAQS